MQTPLSALFISTQAQHVLITLCVKLRSQTKQEAVYLSCLYARKVERRYSIPRSSMVKPLYALQRKVEWETSLNRRLSLSPAGTPEVPRVRSSRVTHGLFSEDSQAKQEKGRKRPLKRRDLKAVWAHWLSREFGVQVSLLGSGGSELAAGRHHGKDSYCGHLRPESMGTGF